MRFLRETRGDAIATITRNWGWILKARRKDTNR
jgi:hypothetical protein